MTYISLVIDIKPSWRRKLEVLRWKIDFFMCNCLKNGVRGRCIYYVHFDVHHLVGIKKQYNIFC